MIKMAMFKQLNNSFLHTIEFVTHKNVSRTLPRLIIQCARTKATTKPLDKVQEEISSNPYFDRYKAQLEENISKKTVKTSDGQLEVELTSELEPELELAAVAKQAIAAKEAIRKAAVAHEHIGPSELPSHVNPLSDYLELPLLGKLSPQEIESLYTDRMKHEAGVAATIPADVYTMMHHRGQECPNFLHMLPREDGFELYLSQIDQHQCGFTPLLEFQTHQENARPSLSLSFYTELKQSKGLVFMRGEFDPDYLKPQEAQLLVNQLQIYYATPGEDNINYQLVKTMNHKPTQFDHTAVLHRFQQLFAS
eukprot:TRINITY_DN12360_c0_g4_i3.p1 TRINITY_DN12360_c0_g4~~TRINITY_DN12360_c0_g4_i3.p1  ORF type:complete len:308 (+),score=90.17 TRINITY_DN12360_c0_g4_i3:96-1019(+)